MSFIQDQFSGYRHPFVFGDYFGGVGDYPRTITELAMCQCSAEIRSRPNWWKDHEVPAMRDEWAEEMEQRVWKVRTPSVISEVQLSVMQVDYILDELSGYAALRDQQTGCQVSCFERIWETTSFPQPPSILNHRLSLLRKAASRRTPSPPFLRLIDPFLHALIYNKTLVSLECTRPNCLNPEEHVARTVPAPTGGDVYTISTHSAFLPSKVFIPLSSGPNNPVKFTSYINNVHPKLQSDLYASLSSLLTSFVPLFERTLTDLHRNNPLMQRIPGTCRYTVWDEPEEPEYSDDEQGWGAYEAELKHWVMNRPIKLPDVPDAGYTGGLENRKHTVSLDGRTVQVVVDVTEIQLEPGDPPYAGSPWHVEGMRNERIVACGLYYASIENLTPSSLDFRMAVTYPRGFMAGDTGATLRTWGLRDGDACHQYVGLRDIEPGLALTFPNIYQHRQTPFSLVDPTKPGHQTVVSFLLIDPEVQGVQSTAEVAPQQREWVRMAVDEAMDKRVPKEVVDQIVDAVDGAMDLEEAERYAEELRELRGEFRDANDTSHFCIPFDIWSAPDRPNC